MYSYGVPNGPVIKHTLRCFWQAMGENEELLFPVFLAVTQPDAYAHTQTNYIVIATCVSAPPGSRPVSQEFFSSLGPSEAIQILLISLIKGDWDTLLI